ncbi:DNA/RNA helicase domain-containing protein [Microbacterium sp. NPDC076911]|uniref:DNA/RNA helicase domain-containing protein n=1 Tax=Microbacterium sp. NPDC076911 TaxID=3154958 RepID=UPI003416A484
MTPSEIERFDFTKPGVDRWAAQDERRRNWPVVYVLDGAAVPGTAAVYVGETIQAATRIHNHLANDEKRNSFRRVRVVMDETFNKSACLDLESHLIRWLAGDGQYTVMNVLAGVTDSGYYERNVYREGFREIFEKLRADGVFQRSIPEIENSDLFKLSPFKVLTREQAISVDGIVEGLLEALATGAPSTSVIEGNPGTGKTIVAIYLMKMLADIRDHDDADEVEPDSMFAEFFVPENRELLSGLRIGFVVPQQSLRESIKRVFKKTPKLAEAQILTPFDVGASDEPWDVLVVDETHRLNQRANQSSGVNNKRFVTINEKLFGVDDPSKTQLDWIRAQSTHQIYLLDAEQTVRPADLPQTIMRRLVSDARAAHRHHPLVTQMRVRAGTDYVAFVRAMLRGELGAVARPDFGEYDLRVFDDLSEMRREILDRNVEHGLARLVAGYAWEWKSSRDKEAFDIEIEGLQLRWNSQAKDWINSAGSIQEVGSIHTVQGYDLNYAGVIIGNDLRYDPATRRLFIDRTSYRDAKGKENNKKRGISYSDEDLLEFIRNIYGVLLTRGIRGTYIYVCDPELRKYIAEAVGVRAGDAFPVLR